MPEESQNKPEFSIDAGMVKHVAYLVRLGIQEEEAQAFSHQFTAIIDYFRLLNEVDTENVTPASETSGTRNGLRPDQVRPSMPQQDFLKNVPHQNGAFVQVPLVFGEE